MNSYGISPSLSRLIDEFARLPSIGRKTAQRIAFHLLKRPGPEAENLSRAITEAHAKTRHCQTCFSYCEEEICEICSAPSRKRSVICVLEQSSDIYPLEKIGNYKGLYHVLGGALSPLDGVTPEDLRIKELLSRIDSEVNELIIATNPNAAGETTALYITKLVSGMPVKVTRLARGIPMGTELEFTDAATLQQAFNNRTELA